jgi:hypothetical protein
VTAPPVDQAAAVTAQQAATRASIAGYLNLLWSRLTSWRGPDAAQFAGTVAPIITGGQQRMAALTAAHLEQMVRANGGTPGRLDLSGLTDADLRGVPAAEVYQRPFRQIWTDLSQGKPLDEAVTSAGHRLQSLAATDLQLAKTHTAQRILSGSTKVTGYQRVLGPDEHHCALCLLTSSRVYRKAELMPIHPGCQCTPVPVFAGDPPPSVDPEAVHEAVRATLGDRYVNASGRGYRDLVVVHTHSELGPVLGVRGQHFEGKP